MEHALKDQSSVSGSNGGKSAKLLRYPLRSSLKSKDDKPSTISPSIASGSRRGKSASSVSQSVDVLELSAKEKSAKPPRRLSIPSKPTVSPAPKSTGYITPISETRAIRAGNIKCKSETPGSDVSRSLNRKKFTVLSSASYWLSHIKLSEAAGKHQLSLGFFKLALEAGCENVQLLKDELKSYAGHHNLLVFDLGESAKEVFERYGIQESIEQLQVSETCSHVPEEGSRSLDEDDANSLSSATGVSRLKPKSLNKTASSAAKEATKKSNPAPKIKAPVNKKTTNQNPGNDKMQKNSKKPSKQGSNKEQHNAEIKPAGEKVQIDYSLKEEVLEENKENMDAPSVEEMSLEA